MKKKIIIIVSAPIILYLTLMLLAIPYQYYSHEKRLNKEWADYVSYPEMPLIENANIESINDCELYTSSLYDRGSNKLISFYDSIKQEKWDSDKNKINKNYISNYSDLKKEPDHRTENTSLHFYKNLIFNKCVRHLLSKGELLFPKNGEYSTDYEILFRRADEQLLKILISNGLNIDFTPPNNGSALLGELQYCHSRNESDYAFHLNRFIMFLELGANPNSTHKWRGPYQYSIAMGCADFVSAIYKYSKHKTEDNAVVNYLLYTLEDLNINGKLKYNSEGNEFKRVKKIFAEHYKPKYGADDLNFQKLEPSFVALTGNYGKDVIDFVWHKQNTFSYENPKEFNWKEIYSFRKHDTGLLQFYIPYQAYYHSLEKRKPLSETEVEFQNLNKKIFLKK